MEELKQAELFLERPLNLWSNTYQESAFLVVANWSINHMDNILCLLSAPIPFFLFFFPENSLFSFTLLTCGMLYLQIYFFHWIITKVMLLFHWSPKFKRRIRQEINATNINSFRWRLTTLPARTSLYRELMDYDVQKLLRVVIFHTRNVLVWVLGTSHHPNSPLNSHELPFSSPFLYPSPSPCNLA